jgi:osmoprotectant transport system substrate-binding protein
MRHVRRALVVLLVLLLLVAPAACGSEDPSENASRTVTVVGQKFTEADVMSRLYSLLLDKAGYRTRIEELGARDLYVGPLGRDEVQVSTDHLSSMTEALNREANGETAAPVSSPDVDATLARLRDLAKERGITALEPTPAESGTGFAVTRAFARRFRLASLSDLGRLGRPVTLAADPDCSTRPDCALGLTSIYGIELSRIAPLGLGSGDIGAALTQGVVQVGQVGTTDGTLDTLGLVLLQDDRSWQHAENLVPLVNSAWVERNPKARAALESLSGVLTTSDLRALNAEVDGDGRSAAEVAEDYLEEKGLL